MPTDKSRKPKKPSAAAKKDKKTAEKESGKRQRTEKLFADIETLASQEPAEIADKPRNRSKRTKTQEQLDASSSPVMPEFKEMQAPIDKQGAEFFLNQNSGEPVTEPDEMVPLWKILHLVGADWTYGSKGWGGENYCMFLAYTEAWEHIVRTTANQADDLGCKVFLNTE